MDFSYKFKNRDPRNPHSKLPKPGDTFLFGLKVPYVPAFAAVCVFLLPPLFMHLRYVDVEWKKKQNQNQK